MKTKRVKCGSRTLNDREITLIVATIKTVVKKRVDANVRSGGYYHQDDDGYYRPAYCYQPRTCPCDTCDVVMQALEKLRPNQESAFRLFDQLRKAQIWFTYSPILAFCEPDGFRTAKRNLRHQRAWIADINTVPLDTIVTHSATLRRRELIGALQYWNGSFEDAKQKILDRVKGRKVRNVGGLCRALTVFAYIETVKTKKTVTIHVDEIRRRLRKRQYGDLIRIVSRLGPEHVELDDDFNQLLAMKWLGSGDRTRAAATVLAQRFKRAGKSIGGNTASACLT